ncbi:MAG: SPW repeat protein [Rhodospirillales bacterium]|nr:SPW repeat protein [Rhodospirillales bacterium]MBI2977261.1 SPW repeat protein [Rhodospirillales bacterium]
MKRHWQDWLNVILGLWIFVLPWSVLHPMAAGAGATTGATVGAMWNLYIVGSLIAVVAAMALVAFKAWEEWINLVLGGWLVISPWVVGFSTSTLLMWNAVIVGALVVLFAGWSAVPASDSTADTKHV